MEQRTEAGITCHDACFITEESRTPFCLENLNVSLLRGFVYGVAGPSGAGKSFFLHVLATGQPPSSGTVWYDGEFFWEDETKWRSHIACVYPEPNFPIRKSPAKLEKWISVFQPGFDHVFFQEVLKRLHVPHTKSFSAMSAGTMKKGLLALALARRPDFLFLDSVTDGVDPIAREEILDLIREFMQNPRHMTVFATQSLEDLERIADYLLVFREGKLIASEEKDALKKRYRASSGSILSLEDIMQQIQEG